MLNVVTAAGLGVAIVLLLVYLRWRWKFSAKQSGELEDNDFAPSTVSQIVRNLCPHNNVVQGYDVEEKDSLDEHLDVLTKILADKEGRLRISRSKIRETQNEIENLIDHDVRNRYREIMDSLRTDLLTNEKECKKLQEQIEWVSRRRIELKEEVRHGQMMYGEAAAELAINLSELQRGRLPEQKVVEKPRPHSPASIRCRKEPNLTRATSACSLIQKISGQIPNTTTSGGISVYSEI